MRLQRCSSNHGRSMWCCVRFKKNRTDIMIQDSVSIICAVVFRRSSPQNFTFTRLWTHSLSVQKRRHHEALLSAAFSRRSTSLTYLSGYDGGCIILSPNAYCLSNQTFLQAWKTLWKLRTFSFSLFSNRTWDARTVLGEMCCDSDNAAR